MHLLSGSQHKLKNEKLGDVVNLLVYSGFRLFKSIAIGSSSEVSLFFSYFVMHPVPLYLSISGHLKPYGSLTLGYRDRFSRSATSYLSPLNLLTARSRRLIFSIRGSDGCGGTYGTIWFMGVGAKYTAGTAGGFLRISSSGTAGWFWTGGGTGSTGLASATLGWLCGCGSVSPESGW